MNIAEYLDYFIYYQKLDDDKRIKVLTSNQQKLIYTYARKNKTITLEEINSLYTDEKNPLQVIKQFVGFEILKPIDENTYEFIKYQDLKTANESINEKDTLFDKMKHDNKKDNGEL